MTRCLFAQLEQKQSHPPKVLHHCLEQFREGGDWPESVVRGCKLLTGLEILYQHSRAQATDSAQIEPIDNAAIPNTPLSRLCGVMDATFVDFDSTIDRAWLVEMQGVEREPRVPAP
jgi:hypothetical protein